MNERGFFLQVHIESSEVMHVNKKVAKGLVAAIVMLILIFDAKTAASGAANGISLCIQVLIPSLFPFFVFSTLLTSVLIGTSSNILRPLGSILRIPPGSESLFLIGILGGYPVGAQSVCQARKDGYLQSSDAMRMIGFCSNAGPAFVFGVVSIQFPSITYAWLIWGVLILSATLTAFLLPSGSNKHIVLGHTKEYTIAQSLEKSLRILVSVCGWVILFRIVVSYMDKWFLWMLPKSFIICIQMLLELGIGCTNLINIDNVSLRFVACTTGLAFGGLCVLFQTISVAGKDGIGLYLPEKLLQALIASFISVIVVSVIEFGFHIQLLICIILLVVLTITILTLNYKKQQKNCGNIVQPVV